ncbi:FtsX-like permease family protein [Protaetiibacter intestinalis]|uniref:ABC transporter permease n=1 Tax=Protaetiibacter intestinalis TaxID=2419774 RepID=A0A387B939_9MICO|nr:FtsX-like permease family protein [Protaetiibacter intestinalis]AYF97695.1 ABC transporter permease [Protaetiibacter intestinalis]
MSSRADAALPSRSKRTSRVAARIAWRTALRHPGRSALIVALVALPTIGLAAGTVLITSTVPTTDEKLAYALGRTEAMVQAYSPPDPTLDQSPTVAGWAERDVDENYEPTGYDPDAEVLAPDAVFPTGTRVLSTSEVNATVRTDAGIDAVTVIEGDAGDPALEGRYHLAEGRAPQRDDEFALSGSALERLGVELGGTVRIVAPRTVTGTVVGVIEDRARSGDTATVFARDGAVSDVRAADDPTHAFFYLPDTELDWSAVRELNQKGWIAYSRQVVEHPPAPGDFSVGAGSGSWTDDINSGYISLLLLIGGFAVFQVCLLAGAAFIVGMRADQRSLATVASVGGDPRLVSRIVSMGGVVLGGVGGLIGIGLGVLAGWGYYALTDDGNAVTLPGFHPWPLALLPVLAVGVLAGWLAALAAARGARRIDVVAALRGSRRPQPAHRRRAVAGTVVALVGAGLLAVGGLLAVLGYWPRYQLDVVWIAMAVLVGGAIVLQLGLALTTPALLGGAARILSRVGDGARLASRDASRNHARSVPAAAAVMSTVCVAVFLMTYLASGQKTIDDEWRYEVPIGDVSGDLAPVGLFDPSDPSSASVRTFPTDDQVDDVRALFSSVLGTAEVTVLEAVLDPMTFGAEQPDAEWTTPHVYGVSPCEQSTPSCVPSFPYEFGRNDHLYVGDANDLAVILGHKPDDDAARMLAGGGAIAFWPEYVEDGKVTLDTWSDAQLRGPSEGDDPLRSVTVPALSVASDYTGLYGVLLSRSAADRLGLDYGPVRVVAPAPGGVSDRQYQALWAGMQTLIGNASARYEAGPPQYAGGFAWAMLGLVALITFASASVAIGLARADGRRDDEVLDAVGAPPRLRRSVAFWQAIVVAGIGTLLGAAVGVLPVLTLALATRLAQEQGGWTGGGPLQDFAAPWLQLGLAVVGVPLAIAIGSWATAGRRRVAVRRVG